MAAESVPAQPNLRLLDPTLVYPEEWAGLQLAQRDALRARVPREQWDVVDRVVQTDDVKSYRATRKDPSLLVKSGEWRPQMFRKPLIAIMYDNEEVIGGVLTADNASPPLMRTKMYTPPWLPVPVLGGRLYVHYREGFVHPDVPNPLDTPDKTALLHGITLRGLWYSLAERHKKQEIGSYVLPEEDIDTDMLRTTNMLGFHETGRDMRTPRGFDHKTPLVRVQAGVAAVMHKIETLPGMPEVIDGTVVDIL